MVATTNINAKKQLIENHCVMTDCADKKCVTHPFSVSICWCKIMKFGLLSILVTGVKMKWKRWQYFRELSVFSQS